ncbi:MAG: SCP2 sterol-binding domain-containing protein [Acidimicrobiales bacterium]
MARFLSPEWMDELTRAAAGDDDLATAGPLVLQQVVTSHPGEPAEPGDGATTIYALCFGDGRLRVLPGGVARPDVTMITDYETAAAVNRGDLSPQAALLAGRVRVRGDSGALVRSQAALARAQACWEPMRAQTSY